MKHTRNFFNRAWPIWLISFSALLLVAGLILFRWQIVSGQSAPASSSADQAFIQGLRQALSSHRLNAADRQTLQKKLEYTERLAAQQANKPQNHGPKGPKGPPVPMPTSPAEANADPQERVVPGSESLVHPWEASINNLWQGTYNNVPYQVLAGSAPDDPAQGLVIVIQYSSGQPLPTRHTYRPPARSGSLTILERQGSRLRCATADGAILYFDLDSRTFQ